MNIAQAINIVNPLGNSSAELKSAYRAKSREYHPDRHTASDENFYTQIMQTVNEAFTLLEKLLGSWTVESAKAKYANKKSNEESGGLSIDQRMVEVYEQIKHCTRLEIEVCGIWLWVGGETYHYRKIIKETGMKWSRNKSKWYWRPAEYKKWSQKVWNMEEIRGAFGSQELETEEAVGLV